jgi:hypothetical protein
VNTVQALDRALAALSREYARVHALGDLDECDRVTDAATILQVLKHIEERQS